MTREPKSPTVLAARLARAYPMLSAYSAACLAEELCSIERAQRRHAERCCSGADGGYVRWIRGLSEGDNIVHRPIHDPDAEERARKRVRDRCSRWVGAVTVRASVCFDDGPKVTLQGDPRGAVLTVRLPGEAEAVAV